MSRTILFAWLLLLSLACGGQEEKAGAFVRVPSAGGGGAPSGAAGGNLSGTYPNPVVSLVNGVTYGDAGALTTGQVPRVTGVSSTAYGALDLANANAVTGVLPTGNMSAATAGAAGTVQLAGNLGGSSSSPTVVGLTIPSEAQGDVLYRNASSWVRLGAGTTGQALVTAGAAANPAWGTSFGANNVVTTGSYSAGTTPATTGDIRLPNNGAGIVVRNAANSANLTMLTLDSSNIGSIGSMSSGITAIQATSAIGFTLNSTSVANISTTALNVLVPPSVIWAKGVASPAISQAAQTTDVACNAFTVTSQGPFASATGTNRNPPGFIVPAAAAGGTEGAHKFTIAATVHAQVDGTIADTETSLLLRRNVGGAFTLQRVTMGAADSGGAGFKVLRVAN